MGIDKFGMGIDQMELSGIPGIDKMVLTPCLTLGVWIPCIQTIQIGNLG